MRQNSFSNRKKVDKGYLLISIALFFFGFFTVYPFLVVIFTSISDPVQAAHKPIIFFPRGFSLVSFLYVFQDYRILTGFKNSIIYTVVGTFFNLVVTGMAGYALSDDKFKLRRTVMKYFIFTMFFGGGFIPLYVTMVHLNLTNTMWALVLCGSVSTFNLILVKTYMQELPTEIKEAAIIDGAGDIVIFFKIIFPMSLPIFATIGLYTSVGFLNSYFLPLLFFSEEKKYPLQVFVRQIVLQSQIENNDSLSKQLLLKERISTEQVKASTLVVSIIPIMLIYPFVQKYFVKGIMVGAVKG